MLNTAKYIKIDPDLPTGQPLAEAAQQLTRGKVAILPTRCLYGLATNALDPVAVNRIFNIKKRTMQKPLLVLISHLSQALELTTATSQLALKLMQHFWPGKVTFLLNARKGLPAGLVGTGNKVGIRLAAHPVAAALVSGAGVPLTGTSANISGIAGCYRIDQMQPEIMAAVDLVIDAGPLLGGVGSSVVDATLPIPKMLRQGALKVEEFNRVLLEMQ